MARTILKLVDMTVLPVERPRKRVYGEETVTLTIQDQIFGIGETCQRIRLAVAEDQLVHVPADFDRSDLDKEGRHRLACWAFHQFDAERSTRAYRTLPRALPPPAIPAPPAQPRATAEVMAEDQ